MKPDRSRANKSGQIHLLTTLGMKFVLHPSDANRKLTRPVQVDEKRPTRNFDQMTRAPSLVRGSVDSNDPLDQQYRVGAGKV